ncbi:hypothetical protein NW768_011190 [Fusarium equiseti]|uniref:Uncharacterized protein n=1 Tax=Fusarium equiseti TaxID=61235 RepID=A0ABQ8QY33_FUSEQ|nr:hypothetical protein NW768_011190 [Fusarium equiseti]
MEENEKPETSRPSGKPGPKMISDLRAWKMTGDPPRILNKNFGLFVLMKSEQEGQDLETDGSEKRVENISPNLQLILYPSLPSVGQLKLPAGG